MLTVELARELIGYEDWANQQVLEAMEAAGQPDSNAVDLLAHTLAARRVWLYRLTNQSTDGMDVFPHATLDECHRDAVECSALWSEYAVRLTAEELARLLDYRNLRGEPYQNFVWAVLMHLATHGAYHRGQAARAMRAAGQTPATTDFILWARRKHAS
ncbi:hypothetical protein HZA57_10070 [Candidatus Poribacteria bacterium]|nr:hypothetical protein [Candidatus Poribacteria bacterium]